ISMGDDIRLLKNRFAKISQLSIMPPQRVRADQDEFLDMEAPNTCYTNGSELHIANVFGVT
ncbi:hypothetical protein EJB05_25913, partial [Eragrostis curvula]